MVMIIREFTEQDIDEITDLMKSLCSLRNQEFDEEAWRNDLEIKMKQDLNSEVIIAFEENTNQVIGMGHCSIKTSGNGLRFGYISNLIVKEEKRRTGIGEKLLRNMIDYFRRNHIQSIRLALKPNLDEAAKLLFIKLGFQEILRIYELII
ncbi:MAG: GNAT family N-acetyltransferase [Candidatus Hodarchaeota archaeon]